MNKKRNIIYVTVIVVLLGLGLHFVPIDSRTGYLDKGIGNLCIGYLKPVELNYRWITGGVNDWDNNLSYLKDGSLNKAAMSCSEPVHMRLYVL